jgi:hypothetical protein
VAKAKVDTKTMSIVHTSKNRSETTDSTGPKFQLSFEPVTLRLSPSRPFGCTSDRPPMQGCQMVCFQTKNPKLGKFWRVLQWKILVYFMTIWSILLPLEILYGHLAYFAVIWYIFPRFGILCQEKSGNPACDHLRGHY